MKKIEGKKVVVVECNRAEVNAVNEMTKNETKITPKEIVKGSIARILDVHKVDSRFKYNRAMVEDGNNDKFIIHLGDNSKNIYYQIICKATEERF